METEIFSFLTELQRNNNRVWFKDHKERYDVLRESFIKNVQTLINRLSPFDPELAGLEAEDCLFRIYRDIRFSPNKLPYKTHFAAYLALGGRKSERGGYYLHLEPGGSMLSGGIWCPSPKLLKNIRQDIFDHMDEFTALLNDPSFKSSFPQLEGEPLKRMPVGYPSDTPNGELLKYKDYCVVKYISDDFFKDAGWIDKAVAEYQKLIPFNRFLNYSVDSYLGKI